VSGRSGGQRKEWDASRTTLPLTHFAGAAGGSVAESTISQYPFSPDLMLALQSLDEEVGWNQYLEKPVREMKLAADLLNSLVAAAKHHPAPGDSARTLDIKRVAGFLACVAMSEKSDLARNVKTGLQSLGIESSKPGRPKGQKADALYRVTVECLERAIEQNGIFTRKSEIRRKFGRKWESEFSRLLVRENWPSDCFHWLTSPKATPRVLAINIASDKFDLEYDRIYRACRKAAKTVQK
jgi:hypothetical protein